VPVTTNGYKDDPTPMRKLTPGDVLIPVAIIIAGAMISGSIIWTAHQATQQQMAAAPADTALPGQQAAPPPANIADVNIKNSPFIGQANAPVVMAYWFDYQCPYCKQEEETVFPQLMKDYVDTGKVKIVLKDFAFLGPDSDIAGRIARAVWEVAPGKFSEWHKAMFDHQDQENAGWGNENDILALTGTIPGIDVAKVKDLLTSKGTEYGNAMQADASEGYSMGVGGTPSTLVGKEMMVGAQPYEKLKAAIDAQLKATTG
jgi:protein-disulfide isomerase